LLAKANLYWGLGICYQSLLKPDDAILAFDRSLTFKTKLLGPDHPDLVELLLKLAELHDELKHRPLVAIPLAERALAISEARFGPESAEAANALASLGNSKDHTLDNSNPRLFA
jgi:tetratricopeptide (TPR) repeat protein